MAVPFLHNIDLNQNELINARLETNSVGSEPSSPVQGSIWFDTTNNVVRVYKNGGWNNNFIFTEAIANGGTNLATADQIHTFVTTQTDAIAADTSGTAAKVTVTDSDANTDFPIVFHNESNGLLDDTGIFEYNPNTGNLNLPKANFDGVFLVGTVSADPIIRSTSNDQTIYIQTQTGGSTVTNLAISPTSISGTAIKDEDNMASDSATHLATQQSIKAYVDSQVTAQDLDFQGDTGGALNIDLDSETLTISGGTGLSTAGSGNTLTVNLDNTGVGANSYGSATAIPVLTINAQGQVTAASTAAISSTLDIAADSGTDNGVVIGTDTLTISGTTNEIETSVSGDTITVGLPNNVTVGGNLTVSGNLTINGTTTNIDTTNLVVEDPLIKLAKNNSADSLDIGFYGLYSVAGTDSYAGLFRDAGDGKFKLFKDLQAEPTTTVNTSGTGYAVASLVANLEGNVTGNASTATQTVNLNNHDTDDLSEGSGNLYYTNARADARIDARSSAHTITGDNSDTEFTITYGFTAAAVNDVMVQVVDNSGTGDGDTIFTEVERHSTTQCKIKFNVAPATGKTYRVLCFKIA